MTDAERRLEAIAHNAERAAAMTDRRLAMLVLNGHLTGFNFYDDRQYSKILGFLMDIIKITKGREQWTT